MKYLFGLLIVVLINFGGPLNAQDGIKNEPTTVKEYKYQGETFLLDDSKGCCVEVTYKGLKGVVSVNIGDNRSDQSPYSWNIDGSGRSGTHSFKETLDSLCDQLLKKFRAAEAAAAFDPKLYCEVLHDGVKNLP